MEIGFEHINLHHFIELVGVEHVRIDVGSLFFRDQHFPKKCEKIKILKNEIFENFSNFQLKNMKKRRKIKKNFPRPSGELKALAGRAKFIPGCD